MTDTVERMNKPSGRLIFRNFSFLTAGKTIGDAFTFLLFVVLSRKFGQQGIGEYSFAMALTGFFVVAADFGLYNLSIKEISLLRTGVAGYFGRILTTRILLSAMTLLVLLPVTYLMPISQEAKLIILLVGIYQVIYTITEGFSGIFVARQQMHVAAWIEFGLRISIAACGIAIAFLGGSLVAAVAAFPVIALLQALIVGKYSFDQFGVPPVQFSWETTRSLLVQAKPYAAFSFLRQISTRVDVLLLGLMAGAAAAGVYNVAYRVIFLLLFIPYFSGLSIFPIASRLYSENKEGLAEFYNNSLNLMVLVAVPATVGIWIIAPDLILLIFGTEFSGSVAVLRILSILLGLAFIKSIAGTVLTSCDRQADRTKSQFLAAGLNIVGNIVLIPLIGIVGAAISTALSELFLVAMLIYGLRPVCGVPRITRRLIIGVAGAGVIVALWRIFPDLHFMAFIPLAAVAYIGTLLMFKTIREREIPMAMAILSGKAY